MEDKQMMNDNIMIGTAILSTFANKKQNDSIDLMLPFVKYALHEKYTIGEIVTTSEICNFIQNAFAFENLPIAIIDKAFIRLSKNNGCLTYNSKEYTFSKDVSDEHSKIKDKRTHAFMLVDAIVKKLTPYLNSKSFKSYTDEDSKRVLFNFLDKYGLSTIDNSLIDSQISKFENTNRIVGSFILEECESNSETFNKLIELIKGVFLSKAIYLQTNNENIFKARMKDIVIILDAPLMLSILGLKTEGENRVAQEFLQVLPSGVKLHYFQHNFKELDSIIRSYMHQRQLGGKYIHTLEFFDEKDSSIEDIELFSLQLDKKLRCHNITEYPKEIPIEEQYFIDEKGLAEELKEKIPSYKNNEKALEIDIDTISYINRLRRGASSRSIEKCKVIFITNNQNLVHVSNKFLGFTHDIGCSMSEIDFTILMWLKNSKKNSSVPKDILVANAMAATEEVTENFMEGVFACIKRYQLDGGFDEESAGLILENIYCRRELVEICNGDPSEITIEKIKFVQEKYEDKIREKAGIDNKKLKTELDNEKQARLKAEQDKKDFMSNLRNKAKKKATQKSQIVKWSILIILSGILLGFGVLGTISCIEQGLIGKVSVLGIIGIAVSIFGLLDFVIGKSRLIIKLSKLIEIKVYEKTYDRKIKEYYE